MKLVILDTVVTLSRIIGAKLYRRRRHFLWKLVDDRIFIQYFVYLVETNYLKGPSCILSGDHLQLPPTIQSVVAEKKDLGQTLFELLADLYGDDVMSMLTVQYRMHELILNWSSEELYSSKIKAHPSVAAHTLYELEDVKKSSSTEPTLLLIDIAGCDMEEKKDEEDGTLNEGEAAVAIAHAGKLMDIGVQAADVGIITHMQHKLCY